MDRKLYLELCQRNATHGKKVFVRYVGNDYLPSAYQLGFNSDGTVRHTAILNEYKSNTLVYCRLQDVEEKT